MTEDLRRKAKRTSWSSSLASASRYRTSSALRTLFPASHLQKICPIRSHFKILPIIHKIFGSSVKIRCLTSQTFFQLRSVATPFLQLKNIFVDFLEDDIRPSTDPCVGKKKPVWAFPGHVFSRTHAVVLYRDYYAACIVF